MFKMILKLNAALTGQVLSASLAIFSNSSGEIPSTSAVRVSSDWKMIKLLNTGTCLELYLNQNTLKITMANSNRDHLYRFLSTFFVVLPTTFVIAALSSLNKLEFSRITLHNFMEGWLLSLRVAYICVLILVPVANRLTDRIFK